jgi:pimeloyl-ACP methyl ester carboxylesterase
VLDQTLNLTPWQFATPHGFTLRGWHSPPSGKPLLHFLHGNSFCGRVYSPMLQVLSHHFDLWLCDVQGHGDSDLGGAFKGWNVNAEQAAAALTRHLPLFGDVPRFAAGHSFGGVLTGLILAEHPNLFQGAVLLDPVIFPPGMAFAADVAQTMGVSRFAPLARAAKQRRQHWPSREAAMDALRGRGTYKGWVPEALQAFAEHALRPADDGEGVVLKCPPSREAEVFSTVPRGLWSALRKVQTHTLVAYASNTFPFIEPSAKLWAQRNRHVSVARVAGGHCFMQCDPAMAAHHVKTFCLRPTKQVSNCGKV